MSIIIIVTTFIVSWSLMAGLTAGENIKQNNSKYTYPNAFNSKSSCSEYTSILYDQLSRLTGSYSKASNN